MASITWGHGFLEDFHWRPDATLATDWVETESGLTCAESLLYDDYLKLEGTCDNAADEWAVYLRTISSLSLSTSTYGKVLVRWKTSASSNGLGLRVVIAYTAGSGGGNTVIVGTTNPEFSTAWTVTSGTLTSGRIIQSIAVYADDYPNTIDSGTFQTYLDFILIHQNVFTIPNFSKFRFHPPPSYAQVPIPGMVGDITQNLGSELAWIEAQCDMNVGNWKRTSDYQQGDIFKDMAHATYWEPWHWLDDGIHQFKVTLDDPVFDLQERTVDLVFREKRRSSASNETWIERYGENL